MRSRRIGLFGTVLGTTLALATTVGAGDNLLDDFADGDDVGWIRDSSGEVFEVVEGRYRLATRRSIPVGANGGFVRSKLAVTDDPEYSNGYFRARIRANTLGTSMNMTLRAPPGGPNLGAGYNFYANTALGRFGIERLGGEIPVLGEVPGETFRPGEEWMVEVGAVGDHLSMKVWRAGDVEPFAPQLRVTDSTYPEGSLVIFNFASFHQSPTVVDGFWDDITFTPGIPSEALAEATPAEGVAPLSVRLSADITAECEEVRYQWTLPDGTTLEGADVDHTFAQPGRYIVSLDLRSENGCRASTNVTIIVQPASVPLDPWQASVIGEPDFGIGGQATQDETGTSIELWAGGDRLSGTGDDNGFVHRELDCDGVVVARIEEIENAVSLAQVGLQMRESLEPGARHASLVVESRTVGPRLLFLHRDVPSEATSRGSETPAVATPVWLRLERRGDVVSGSWSDDGSAWSDAGSADLPGLAPTILVGLVAAANEPTSRTTSFLLLRARLSGVDLRSGDVPTFRRGDANADGAVDLSDVMATFGHLFLGSAAPACPDAADADDSGVLDLSDGVYTLGYLFLGTTAPPLPGPDDCGPDVEADSLGACLYGACP